MDAASAPSSLALIKPVIASILSLNPPAHCLLKDGPLIGDRRFLSRGQQRRFDWRKTAAEDDQRDVLESRRRDAANMLR
jgi:hypothetical protein